MELLTNLIEGFGYLGGIQPAVAIVAGVILGILAGAMPAFPLPWGWRFWSLLPTVFLLR